MIASLNPNKKHVVLTSIPRDVYIESEEFTNQRVNSIYANHQKLGHETAIQALEKSLEKLIGQWHRDRNLIDGSTDKDQFMKLLQEVGELSDSLCKGKDFRDDVGDIMVVLINILVRNGVTIDECLEIAYNDIKDRKGKMVDGVFIKEGDD